MPFDYQIKERTQTSEDRIAILSDLQKLIQELELDDIKGVEKELMMQRFIGESSKANLASGVILLEDHNQTLERITLYILELLDKLRESEKRRKIEYVLDWKETISWFKQNRSILVEELMDYFLHLGETKKMKLKEEFTSITDWLNRYWVEEVDAPFEKWFESKLVEEDFKTVDLEILVHGLTNLLETDIFKNKPLKKTTRIHTNEHLDVSVYVLLNYFKSNSL